MKKLHPDANFKVYEQQISFLEEDVLLTKQRPWFDDGKTGWVRVGVTINGIEHIEPGYPIVDLRWKPIPAENITSVDANKAIQRALTKACARHGLGLYIYEGEDLPEETKRQRKAKDEKEKSELKKLNEANYTVAQEIFTYCSDNSDTKLKTELMNTIKATIGTNNPRTCKNLEKSKALQTELEKINAKIKK